MAELRVENLSVEADGLYLLSAINLTLGPGELIVVIGENGAGKSTLLRAIADYQPGTTGYVTLDGVTVATLSGSQRARAMAWLPQSIPLAWPIRVHDAVALGRFAYGALPGRLSADDAAAVARALDATELTSFVARTTATLSGGELARVHIARALASEAPILIADEPIAALDPRHRLAVMDAIAGHVRAGGSALVVLHDLMLAARYASKIIGMRGGRIMVAGSVDDVMTPEWIRCLFGVDARIDRIGGRPVPIVVGTAETL